MLVFWDSVCICLQYSSSHFKSSLAIQSYRLWRHIGKLCKESSIQCNLGPRRKTSNSCCNIAYIQKAIQQFVQAPEQELTLRWGCSTSNTPAHLLSHSLAATLIKIKGVEQMILYAPLFLWGNRNPEEAICATGSPGCASWPRGETEYFKVLPGKAVATVPASGGRSCCPGFSHFLPVSNSNPWKFCQLLQTTFLSWKKQPNVMQCPHSRSYTNKAPANCMYLWS